MQKLVSHSVRDSARLTHLALNATARFCNENSTFPLSQARLSLRSWLCSTNPPRIKRHRSLLQRKLNVSVVASSSLTPFVALLGGFLGLLLHSDKPLITLSLSFTLSSLLRRFVSHTLHSSLRKIRQKKSTLL